MTLRRCTFCHWYSDTFCSPYFYWTGELAQTPRLYLSCTCGMMRQKREEEGEEENRKEGGAAASSVKEVGETSWSFLTGIANFRQRFWVLRVSILTLNFPQNVGFYPPDLAFLDDNFRTRRRFFRQFFDGQKFKWGRVELARSPYTFLATTPLPSVISKSCRLCPALLLLLLLLGRVRQRSN